jgi:hypothetical protein
MGAKDGPGIVPAQVSSVAHELVQADGFAFRDVLDENTLADTTAQFFSGYRDRVFSP